MQRTVLVQHGYLVGGQQFLGYCLHRNFLPVLPEFRFGVEQHILRVFVQFTQLDDTLYLYGILGNKLSVGDQVIAVDADCHGQLGLDGVAVVILGDVRREILQKLRFIAAGGFGKLADDGLDLRRGKLGNIHVFRFEVFGHHGRDVVRGQLGGQRPARHFLISQHKGGDSVRGQPAHVHATILHVLGDVGGDLCRLQRGNVHARRQLLVGADHGGDVFRGQPGHIRAIRDFGIGADQPNQPFGRERSLIRALRDFGILGDKRLHLGLQLLCRSILLIAGHNHVRGNCAGVFRKGVPALLCAGHVEIGRDLEHFLRQRLAEHGGQAGQLHLAVVEEGLDGRDLLQRRGEVDFREHGLNLALGHAAIQKRLDLGEHGDVLGHRALIHGSGDGVQVFQQRGLFGFRRRAVFAELLGQRIHIGGGFLDVLLLPDGHDHIRQQLRILHRRCPALFGVFTVQLLQRSLSLGTVLHQLNERVFLVILRVDLLIDGGKPLGGGHQRILVDGHIRVLFPTRLRTCDLGFQLLLDGIKAVHVLLGQVILDFNGLTGVDQLLQADFFLFGQEAVLPLF